ncbi:MAG: metalloenzyme [Herpetosiphonaceae bacterium]|nr:metalloenzyme [Herpetosiphonaceae bacterium]
MRCSIIFVMVDGLGLAPPGAQNLVLGNLPLLTRYLGAPLSGGRARGAGWCWHPIDATLRMPGLPQSGTGHSTIYGGFNAAAANGRHQPSYPTVAMRERLAQHNIFIAAQAMGKRVAWANAYLPGYMDAVAGRRLRHTAGTWSAMQAGLPLRGIKELENNTAVSWDIDQHMARMRPGCEQLPVITPDAAGLRLVQLAQEYDLVAFETYLPDLAAHGRLDTSPAAALRLVDGLLDGVIGGLEQAMTLVMTSDHGNIEDMTTKVHTRNPVPLLVVGPHAAAFDGVTALNGLMDAMLATL